MKIVGVVVARIVARELVHDLHVALGARLHHHHRAGNRGDSVVAGEGSNKDEGLNKKIGPPCQGNTT